MTFQKRHFGLLALGASALALSGCGLTHPTSMPGGYTHHQSTYKSADPMPSAKVTVQQRKYMDAVQAEQFRDAVYDLLERITRRAGVPPKPVYVLAPDPMTTFYANIDNDLREGMRHIGYALSDTKTGAYVFAYDAKLLTAPRDGFSAGADNVELVLKVFDSADVNARMLTQDSGRYYIQGAEDLNITPARYRVLPSQTKILNQATGFGAAPVTSFDAAPAPFPGFTPEAAASSSYYIAPRTTASTTGYVSMADPSLRTPRPSVPLPVIQYNDGLDSAGPTRAISIDSTAGDTYYIGTSGAVSYEAPAVTDRSLTTRARISSQMEY